MQFRCRKRGPSGASFPTRPSGGRLRTADGRRGRHVERGRPPPQRHRDERIADARDPRPEARALAPHHQHDGPLRSTDVYGSARFGRRAVDPEPARPLRLCPASPRGSAPAQRPDARPPPPTPCRRRRSQRRPAVRDHDAGRARSLGRAADRAEVVGVLDLVERDDQTRRAPRRARPDRRTGMARPRRRSPGGQASRPAAVSSSVLASSAVTTRSTRRRPRWASATGRRP